MEKGRVRANADFEASKKRSEEFLAKFRKGNPDLWEVPRKENGVFVVPLAQHPSMKILKNHPKTEEELYKLYSEVRSFSFS